MASLFSCVGLDCPICLEIPEAEVYQCKDGHILCSKCYFKVEKCPQCRVPLGGEKIRNRLVESILDETLIPCKYKDVGCNQIKKRKEKRNHELDCCYRWRLWGICDRLGYKCEFKANLLKPAEILNHFQKDHKFHVESKSHANVHLQNFDQIDGSSNITWTPFILKLGERADCSKFLFQIQVSKRDTTLRMGCQLLEDPLKVLSTNYTVTFSIKSNSSKVENIDWSIYPKVFSFSGRTVRLLYCTIFRLPINFLKSHYMSEGCLNLTVNVTTGCEPLEEMNSLCLGVRPLCLLPTEKNTDYWGHSLWSCHECKAKINEHIWYRCLQCPSWTLCRDCMTLKKHSHHVFAMLKGVHQQEYMIMLGTTRKGDWIATLSKNQTQVDSLDAKGSFGMECDHCRCFPFVGGKLYRCLLCPKRLDFCQSCVDKEEHRCHILGVILNSNQEEFLSSQSKYGLSLMPLLASKVNLS